MTHFIKLSVVIHKNNQRILPHLLPKRSRLLLKDRNSIWRTSRTETETQTFKKVKKVFLHSGTPEDHGENHYPHMEKTDQDVSQKNKGDSSRRSSKKKMVHKFTVQPSERDLRKTWICGRVGFWTDLAYFSSLNTIKYIIICNYTVRSHKCWFPVKHS